MGYLRHCSKTRLAGRLRGWLVVCASTGPLLLVGCGHGRAAKEEGEAVRLRAALVESQGRENDLQRRVDELQNRIFLLEDQLESQVLAAQTRAPARLPVDLKADAPVYPEGSTGKGDGEIEYSGDASNFGSPRPMLRLSGRQQPGASSQPSEPQPNRAPASNRPTIASVGNTSAGERLAVLKEIPPVAASRGGASSAKSAAIGAKSQPMASAAGPSTSAGSVAAMKLYQTALAELRQHAHPEAISGFEKFLSQYPAHDYADNAQYWLGECYYDQKNYPAALREFRRVIQRFPSGNKAPDALLKVGLSYGRLDDRKNQRDVLEQVLKSYPGTEVAKKAAETLEAMK